MSPRHKRQPRARRHRPFVQGVQLLLANLELAPHLWQHRLLRQAGVAQAAARRRLVHQLGPPGEEGAEGLAARARHLAHRAADDLRGQDRAELVEVGVERAEEPLRRGGDARGERRLAAAGRAPQDQRGQPVVGERLRKHRAERVALAEQVVEPHRPHMWRLPWPVVSLGVSTFR